MPNLVPNEFRTLSLVYRITIVGEAPGEQDEIMLSPFAGSSGQLLQAIMREHRLMRSACMMANVCHFRPAKNDIKNFSWEGQEIQHGLRQLAADISSYQPNCIL